MPSADPRPSRRRELTAQVARYLGAVSIVLVGVVHAQQYYQAYFSVVPTIGTLFLLSFIGAGVVGAVLLAPVRRLGRLVGDAALVTRSEERRVGKEWRAWWSRCGSNY